MMVKYRMLWIKMDIHKSISSMIHELSYMNYLCMKKNLLKKLHGCSLIHLEFKFKKTLLGIDLRLYLIFN